MDGRCQPIPSPADRNALFWPLAGDLDLGIALFGPDNLIQPSSDAIVAGDTYGVGHSERLLIDLSAQAVYGMVVTNVNGAAGGYRIEVSDPSASGVAAAGLPTRLAFRTQGAMPASGATVFELALPQRAQVDLSVFDISGRRVRTLIANLLEPGNHALTWNGQDDFGRATASALFFARLTADAESRTLKVVRTR